MKSVKTTKTVQQVKSLDRLGASNVAIRTSQRDEAKDLDYKPLAKFATEFEAEKQVDEYLRDDVMQIPAFQTNVGEKMEDIISMAWKLATEKIRQGKVLEQNPGLTSQMVFAIVVFSLELQMFEWEEEDLDEDDFDEPIRHDSEFYFQYNIALRDRNPEVMGHLAGFSHFLFSALMIMPAYQGVLWRGIHDTEAVQLAKESYHPRMKAVHWSAFSSASPNREIAVDFATAGDDGLIFRIETTNCARDIRRCSAMVEEDERTILPNTKFIVDKTYFMAEDGIYEIHLVEAAGDTIF